MAIFGVASSSCSDDLITLAPLKEDAVILAFGDSLTFGFDCVSKWRLEQENKLRLTVTKKMTASEQSLDKIMDKATLARFIKFYQRITEHLLQTLPNKVDYLFELDESRNITHCNLESSVGSRKSGQALEVPRKQV